MQKRNGYLPSFIAGVITLVVFLPSLRNGFVLWDDSGYVVNNAHLSDTVPNFIEWSLLHFNAGFWIPITWLSYKIDYSLWGLDSSGYHLTNVAIHSINAFIVSLLMVRLIEAYKDIHRADHAYPGELSFGMIEAAGLLAGLLFGLHPLRVESVEWIAERKDVLSGLFGLSSLLFYISYAKASACSAQPLRAALLNRKYKWALCLYLLSLMSKPMTVTLPLIFLVIDWYPLDRLKTKRKFLEAVIEKAPFFLFSASISMLTLRASSSGIASIKELPLMPRFIVACKSVILYLKMMILPVNLAAVYDHPENGATLTSMDYLVPFILFLFVTAACIFLARRRRIWLATWASYLIMLFPVLGITQIGPQAWADRFTYLPSIWPTMLVSAGSAVIYVRSIKVRK